MPSVMPFAVRAIGGELANGERLEVTTSADNTGLTCGRADWCLASTRGR